MRMMHGMNADLIALLTSLVAVDSVNPSLVAGGAGEGEIAALVEGWAREHGLETERLEETPGRPSVLVRARGTGGGRTLLLCGHLDVVNVEGMTDPFTPRIEGDRMYGRGTYDMKAGLAAALIAAREAARLGLAGDVVVAAVADEEHASLGIQEALRHVSADAAVVTEPTELELTVAHKGFVWSEIEVTGRAAHGSRPHLGVDAILKMGAVLHGLEALDRELAERTHPLLGRGSLHASLIAGGVELSSYPAQCTLSVERRTLPGETGARHRSGAGGPAGALPRRRPRVRRVPADPAGARPVRDRPGRRARAPCCSKPPSPESPKIGGGSYWADSSIIAAAGIPTVLFGPSGEGAHAVEEWVSLSATEAVTRTLIGLARACAARRPSRGAAASSPGAGSGRCSRWGTSAGSPGARARPPRTAPPR